MLRSTKNTGFTLVELLIAIFVIGIMSLATIRIVFNTVNYRSKQFAIEDTSDSFRDFITNFSMAVRNSNLIRIGSGGEDIEIRGDNCISYRYNNSEYTIERSQNLISPCNSGYVRIIQDSIKIDSFSLSPVGSALSVVNVEIQGRYKDSMGERLFTYKTSVTKRL